MRRSSLAEVGGMVALLMATSVNAARAGESYFALVFASQSDPFAERI
jgi:hypothetical protein